MYPRMYSAVVHMDGCEVWEQQRMQTANPANNSNLAIEQLQRLAAHVDSEQEHASTDCLLEG
jgi:hypothetical protein